MSAQGTYTDLSLSNARRFYSSMGNLLDGKGLTAKNYVPFNALPNEWVLKAFIDLTLSNARRFYSSMGNLLDGKGLSKNVSINSTTWKVSQKRERKHI